MLHLRPGDPPPPAAVTSVPAVLVGVAHGEVDPSWRRAVDVVVDPDEPALADLVANVEAHPLAATSLALLLRGEARPLAEGLAAESAVYSLLQAGPEFARWRAAHPAREVADDRQRVAVERLGPVLTVTLCRPERRNALDARMRDELVAAFELAALDPGIERVELAGEGPSFCAGGDLDEFGTRPDPASAHLVRLRAHVGRLIDAVGPKTTAHLHGACAGSGIELPAFAGRVVARPDTVITLPELALGLIPGAGGTVSVRRRIGRWRTAWLALSGRPVTAATALAWGLVDGIEG